MNERTSQRSLKEQNYRRLWLAFAANAAVFITVCKYNEFTLSGLKGSISDMASFLPVGLALVVTSIVNGLLTTKAKERLVFLRWTHALPGHRAFSKHAPKDPRIDMSRLEKIIGQKVPVDPDSENHLWYLLYKKVELSPAVLHVHKEFLLTRDYTGFSFLFLVVFGTASTFLIQSWKVFLIYVLALLLQFALVRQAAATYGERFVCTVIALRLAGGPCTIIQDE